MTQGMFVPRNYDAVILTFGLGGVAFDVGPLTHVNLTHLESSLEKNAHEKSK
jgi:hypothetical protein